MKHLKWSPSEKRLARSLFDRAVAVELQEIIADFKRRAAEVSTPEQMWALREYLGQTQRDFDVKYDYRYSQLLRVFGHLVREGRITEQELEGLSEEKRQYISRVTSL